MSTITFEQATTVAKSLLSAVTAIEDEHAKLASVRQEAAKAVNAANEANGKLGAANKTLRDVEALIAEKQAVLAKVEAEHAEVYEKKKTAEGQFKRIRT